MRLFRGCVVWLLAYALVYAVLSVLVWQGLRHDFPPPVDRIVALVLAGLLVLLSGFFWQGYQALQDASLLRGAARGTRRWRHDRPAAAVGTIRPLEAPLESPFLGQPCVAYHYTVLDLTHHTEERPAQHATGMALCPCHVEGKGGSLRVLGWPRIEGLPEQEREGAEAARRAEAFLDATSFETVSLARLGTVIRSAKELRVADDGALRKDLRLSQTRPDLTRCAFLERVVPAGAEVCVYGAFDAQRGGLVHGRAVGSALRLVAGDARAALRGARRRGLRQLATGTLLLLLAGGATYGAARALAPSFGEAMVKAAEERDIGALRDMIDAGTDVDARDGEGETALLASASFEVTRLLVAYGADVNVTDRAGETPLMAAAGKADKQMIETLLAAGADPKATDRSGHTARDRVPPGNPELLDLLD